MSAPTTVTSDRPLLTTDEAAAIVGIHQESIARAIRRGQLPAIKTFGGGRWRIRREDLDAYVRGESPRA